MAKIIYPALATAASEAALLLKFNKGFLSPVACLNAAPSQAALSEAKSLDMAAGWPETIASKADARRRAPTLVWVAPDFVHVGTDSPPLKELFGAAATGWMSQVGETRLLGEFSKKWGIGFPSSGFSGSANYDNASLRFNAKSGKWKAILNNSAERKEYLEDATGLSLPPGVTTYEWIPLNGPEGNIGHSAGNVTWFLNKMRAMIQPGECVVGLRINMAADAASPGVPINAASLFVAHVFPATGEWHGVQTWFAGAQFNAAPSIGDLYLLTDEPVGSPYTSRLCNLAIEADDNWVEILSLLGRVGTRTSSGVVFASSSPDVDPLTTKVSAVIPVARTMTTDPAMQPLSGLTRVPGWGGPSDLGVHVYQLYLLGNPEFCSGMSIRGTHALTGVPGAYRLEVTDEQRMFTWSGSLLANLENAKIEAGEAATLQPSEISALTGLIIRSTCLATQYTAPVDPLTKTVLYADATEAGYDIGAEPIVPAEGSLPAITFSTASKNGSAKSGFVWHQVAAVPPSLVDITIVSLRVNLVSSVFSIDALGPTGLVVVATDEQKAVAYVTGVPVINTTGTATSVVVSNVLGLDALDVTALVEKNANAEFDEASYCRSALFAPADMSEGQQGAYACLAYARGRQQLTQVVLSFVSMARLAASKLALNNL